MKRYRIQMDLVFTVDVEAGVDPRDAPAQDAIATMVMDYGQASGLGDIHVSSTSTILKDADSDAFEEMSEAEFDAEFAAGAPAELVDTPDPSNT